jgi:hypothetical protein
MAVTRLNGCKDHYYRRKRDGRDNPARSHQSQETPSISYSDLRTSGHTAAKMAWGRIGKVDPAKGSDQSVCRAIMAGG